MAPSLRKPVRRPEISSIAAINCGYRLRLARPNGTSGIDAGGSGAGESIPAPAQEASRPDIFFSSRATRRPSCAKRRAIAEPTNPAPITIASCEGMYLSYQDEKPQE